MRHIALLALALFVTAALPALADQAPNTLTPEEIADGWILLFDGETLFGWKAANDSDWKVEDGAITATEGEPGLLHTRAQWGNYILKLEFKSEKRIGNSGVFLRTSPKPADVNGRCYEVNIADWGANDWPTPSIVHRLKATEAHDSEDWQQMTMTANGANFTVEVDGEKVLEYTDPNPLGRGYIGLQFRHGKIQFRNIKLKPLGMKPLFDGRSLEGWNVMPLGAGKAEIVEDSIHITGGRDYLEAPGQYEDFNLRLDVYVNGDGLNGGVFYRCIPGEAMNGYEAQISNKPTEDDPTKPADHGTGGIFRRQEARKLVAKDREWFTYLIHVDDRHVATWVNGYQVADWTDTRPADPNPRKGLRLEAGPIQLQAHDPTTDIRVKNLEISTIPPR